MQIYIILQAASSPRPLPGQSGGRLGKVDFLNLSSGIVSLDIHGLTKIQARALIDSRLKKASPSVYRMVIIHVYNGGTELRDMVRSEYRRHPKVKRIEIGLNGGETTLVLRDLY